VQAVRNNVTTDLRIWDKIRIMVGDERDAGIYESRIEDMVNSGIIIARPEFISGTKLLRNDLEVSVQITRGDAAYEFHSRIRVQRHDKSRRFILTPPRRLKRVQRRMFARVDLPVTVTFALLSAGVASSSCDNGGCWIEKEAFNVSAGGILIESPDSIRSGVIIALQIREMKKAGLPTHLVAVCRRRFLSEGKRYAGFEFILKNDLNRYLSKGDLKRLPDTYKQFDKQAQDRLANFLFHKQIELRQKGLI